MGQYFMAMVKTPKAKKFKNFYTWDSHNGAKLMEHSFFGNHYTEAIVEMLVDKPQQVLWVGDYTDIEEDSYKNPSKAFLLEECVKLWNNENNEKTPYEIYKDTHFYCYLVNHTKKVYIHLGDYFIQNVNYKKDSWDYGWCIHPLPLLTATSNGKGGGDYHGINKELVGSWFGDTLEVTYNMNEELEKYKDITNEIKFKEER